MPSILREGRIIHDKEAEYLDFQKKIQDLKLMIQQERNTNQAEKPSETKK